MVQQYRGILDVSLQSLAQPEVVSEPPMNEPDSKDPDSNGLAAAIEEDDEDLAGDLQRAKFTSEKSSARSSAADMTSSGGDSSHQDAKQVPSSSPPAGY